MCLDARAIGVSMKGLTCVVDCWVCSGSCIYVSRYRRQVACEECCISTDAWCYEEVVVYCIECAHASTCELCM